MRQPILILLHFVGVPPCHPCILAGPQHWRAKSELHASAMHSRARKKGRNANVTPTVSGVPNKGEQKQNWLF